MPDPEPAPQSAPGQAQRAAEQGKRFDDARDAIRARSDVTSKAFAGLATTLVTAIGIAKFSDIFPYPPNISEWWAFALVGGFVLMGVAVAGFTFRLQKAAASIVARTNVDDIRGISSAERVEMEEIFDETARLNEVNSLHAYEARALRLQRVADRVDEDDAMALREQAAVIYAEILATLSYAKMNLLRRRSSKVFSDAPAILLTLAFVLGLVSFGLIADYIDGERSGGVAIAQSCADAIKAGATQPPLPPICNTGATPSQSETPESSATGVADATIVALATSLKDCKAAVAEGNGSAIDCKPVSDALSAALARAES